MSEYGQALDFLSAADGGKEHAEAIRAYVKVIADENKATKSKYREAEAQLKRYKEVAGEEDFEATITNLKSQVTTLTSERDEAKQANESITQERDTLKAEKVGLERGAHFRKASEKVGADYQAFESIFGSLDVANIVVSENGVNIKEGDKDVPFEEYLSTQEGWKRSALFHTGESGKQEPQRAPLPSANSTGGSTERENVTDGYIAARYSGKRFGK